MSNMLIAEIRGRFGYVEAIGDLDKTSFSNLRKRGKEVKHTELFYEFCYKWKELEQ